VTSDLPKIAMLPENSVWYCTVQQLRCFAPRNILYQIQKSKHISKNISICTHVGSGVAILGLI